LSIGISFPTIFAFLSFFFLEDLEASINYYIEGVLEARILLILLPSLSRPKELKLVASILLVRWLIVDNKVIDKSVKYKDYIVLDLL
jgi:hypothetical protein